MFTRPKKNAWIISLLLLLAMLPVVRADADDNAIRNAEWQQQEIQRQNQIQEEQSRLQQEAIRCQQEEERARFWQRVQEDSIRAAERRRQQ